MIWNVFVSKKYDTSYRNANNNIGNSTYFVRSPQSYYSNMITTNKYNIPIKNNLWGLKLYETTNGCI